MLWLSFILALAAVVIFLAGYWVKRLELISVGLGLTALAWILQIMVTAGPHWTIH